MTPFVPQVDPRPSPLTDLEHPVENASIAAGFLRTVDNHAAQVAVVDARRSLTYAQLERLSRQLAQRILDSAESTSGVVAIHGHRNSSLVVAMLATVRAGFTFAVLDAAYPRERLRRMLQIIRPALVVGDDGASPEWRQLFDGLSASQLSVDPTNSAEHAAATPSATAVIDCTKADFAYLLFTSGTTGDPKCIATRHAPLRHFIDFYLETFKPTPGARFSLLSGLGHDPVLRDIFVPLTCGGEIRIPEQSVITSPRALFEWVRDNGINYLHGTPQLLRLLCAGAQAEQSLTALRCVFSGGDQLRRPLVNAVRSLAPAACLVNFYGTTETPQAMGYHVVTDDEGDEVVPVGKGIRDTQLLVLTDDDQLAEVGAPGQIAIRTHYLSAGYWGNADATSERFVKSPFSKCENDRIFLTGDYGVYRSDGAVLVRGRNDDQVKIRGYRVELAEINRVMESVASVRSAIALAHTASNGETVLVAYLVASAGPSEPLRSSVEQALKASLPPYMVPARMHWLDDMPLLPNGKVDRQALNAIWTAQQQAVERATSETAATDPIELLANQWCRTLGLMDLDRGRSFVDLGGDSLSYIQVSAAVERTLGYLPANWDRIPFRELAQSAPRSAGPFQSIGTTILVRALAIVVIVMGHSGLPELAGTTSALFILSGWSLAKFQLESVLSQQSVRPLLSSALRIVLPTLFATAVVNWGHLQERWWAFLMLSNYFPIGPSKEAGFWFIDVLIQIYIVFAALFSIRAVRELLKRRPYEFGLGTTCLAMVGGMVVHRFWDTSHLTNWVPHMKIWLVFYGIALLHANTLRKKLPLLAIIVFSAAIGHFSAFALISGLLVISFERVPVPSRLVPVIAQLASASLYIYVSEDLIRAMLRGTWLGSRPELQLLSVLLGGVLFAMLWKKTAALVLTAARTAVGYRQPLSGSAAPAQK